VTLSHGVPTIWLGFAEHLAATGARCTTLRSVLSGGAAVPPALIEAFEYRGIAIVQGWG
jgi:fatty-acyl-CoA synthase